MIRRILRVVFIVLVLSVGLLCLDAYQFLTTPLNTVSNTVVQINPGSSFRAITRKLLARKMFTAPRQGRYFSVYARLRGVAQKVHSGEYEIHPGMTPLTLLDAMVAGRTKQYRLTIVEGWTFAELRVAMQKKSALNNTLQGKSDAEVMQALAKPGEMPEGRFLPDTYKFPRGTTDVAFLKRAYNAMQKVLDKEWPARAPNLALKTPYEALILASIVEKETAAPEERERIAGVFLRRLKLDMPLQTDPTVIYGVPNFDGNLRRKDLTRDGPYNTYTRRGLPPTPIALPGRASIHASLHPAPGDALYFVSKGNGHHAFSATLAEHNQAVRKYQLKQ